MTTLRLRSARLAWLWCLLYTAPVRPDLRDRRRDELLSHLWESEAAGVQGIRLLSAALRGVLADLSWSVRRGWRHAVGQPETWVAVAAMFPIAAWIGAMVSSSHGVDLVGGLGGPFFLTVSGATWARRRKG